MPGFRAQPFRLTPALTNVSKNMGGAMNLHRDTLTLSGVKFARVDGDVSFGDGKERLVFGAGDRVERTGHRLGGNAQLQRATLRPSGWTRCRSCSTTSGSRWSGRRRFASSRALVVVDTVVLTAGSDERMTIAASIPDSLPIAARLVIQAIPLSDVSTIAQSRIPLGGDLSGTLEMTGTRGEPSLNVERDAQQRHRRRREGGTGLDDGGSTLIGGSWRIGTRGAVRHDRADGRRELPDRPGLECRATSRVLDDTMRVKINSPDVGLEILESFTHQSPQCDRHVPGERRTGWTDGNGDAEWRPGGGSGFGHAA